MSKLKTEPKLIQWANDRFPPVSNDFILDNSTELIREYQELHQQNQELREALKYIKLLASETHSAEDQYNWDWKDVVDNMRARAEKALTKEK